MGKDLDDRGRKLSLNGSPLFLVVALPPICVGGGISTVDANKVLSIPST
jgi:hypothetical protein